MNRKTLLALLAKEIREAGSQAAWADKHGLRGSYVSDVLNGRRDPGPAILKALGVRKVEEYVKDDGR